MTVSNLYTHIHPSPQHPGSVRCPPGSWLQGEPHPAISGWWLHHWRLWPYLGNTIDHKKLVNWIHPVSSQINPFVTVSLHLCYPPSVCPSPWVPGWSWQPQQSPGKENPRIFSYTDTTHRKSPYNQGEKSCFSDLAGIDVTDELGNALRRVCPLLQQDNWCGLERERDQGREEGVVEGRKPIDKQWVLDFPIKC